MGDEFPDYAISKRLPVGAPFGRPSAEQRNAANNQRATAVLLRNAVELQRLAALASPCDARPPRTVAPTGCVFNAARRCFGIGQQVAAPTGGVRRR